MMKLVEVNAVRPCRHSVFALLCLLVMAGFAVRALAQEEIDRQPTTQPSDVAEPVPTGVTAQTVRDRISQIESAADLDDTVKTELLDLYRQAFDQITSAENWEQKVLDYRAGREKTPELLESAKRRLAEAMGRPSAQPAMDVPPDATIEHLAGRLAETEADLKGKQDEAQKLDAEAKNRSSRTAAIPDLLADANKRREAVAQDLGAPPAEGVSPQIALARRTLLLAQKRAAEQEIQAYEEELRFYEVRSDLLSARRDRAKLDVTGAQALATAWQTVVSERRQAEVKQQKQQAEQELQRTPRAILELAEANSQLAEERGELAAQIDKLQVRFNAVTGHSETLAKKFSTLQDNIDQPVMADYVGPLMRKMRAALANLRSYEHELRADKLEFARVQSVVSETEAKRWELTDIETRVAAELRSLEESETDVRLESLEPKVRELLTKRRETLDGLKQDYETYSVDLIQLITAENRLLAKVDEYGGFVDERVLWIRSTGPIYTAKLPDDWGAVGTRLTALGASLLDDASGHPFVYGIAALAFVSLLILQSKLRAGLRSIHERVSKAFTDSYVLTLAALACTVALSLVWPTFFWFWSWRVRRAVGMADAELYELAQAIGAGLGATAVLLLTLAFVRHACRPKGLAESHFRWNAASVRLARRDVTWLMLLSTPVVFLVAGAERHPEGVWRDSPLGRAAFIIGMAALAAFAWRFMHPGRGVLAYWLRQRKTAWPFRMRHVWYPAILLIPIVLAIAAFVGYYYTAVQLTQRLVQTAWLVLGVLFLHAMLVRWLFIAQRRLAIEQAKKKRAALAEAKAGDQPAGSEMPPIEESTLSLVTIGEQTRTLLRSLVGLGLAVGLWGAWSDMLPALSFLEDVHLWRYGVETVVAAGENGGAAQVTERIEYITLAHVLLAGVVGIATYVLAKNIPGLLEIVVLQRLPIDTGGRFAATAIARYLITVIGVVIGFGVIGVGWSKVQWLVAAISVGLGFGLQEIFANFVSGLMLLFERPIRIGDTVTVGEITGTVTRIRIRATTITDWDRKELVIPNKEFIAGQVVNWTLSDAMVRITIPVGIAYGSDTDLAEQLLHRVAKEEPNVLNEPEPYVLFMGFGSSSLDFELRVYVASVEHRLQTRHVLHKAIDQAFRKAGVEIAFPQHDLHIRTVDNAIPVRDKENEAVRTETDATFPVDASGLRR